MNVEVITQVTLLWMTSRFWKAIAVSILLPFCGKTIELKLLKLAFLNSAVIFTQGATITYTLSENGNVGKLKNFKKTMNCNKVFLFSRPRLKDEMTITHSHCCGLFQRF